MKGKIIMKITGFRPLIISAKANDAIELFEVLGFEKRHTKTGIEGKMKEYVTTVAMKDANGFRVNVAQADKIPSDLTVIAMNVDDFDEAYEFLKARGFVNEQGTYKGNFPFMIEIPSQATSEKDKDNYKSYIFLIIR